jgi:hypothetical protein
MPGVTLSVGESDVATDLLEELAGVYAGTALARLAGELAEDLGRQARGQTGGTETHPTDDPPSAISG